MKKLRLFDSLKLVLATVACVFILNVAHADTNAIQSVIAYGKTEQSATPTPTNPVPIMTNNGVLKASANLLNPATVPDENKYVAKDGSAMAPSSNGTFRHSDFIPVQGGKPIILVLLHLRRVLPVLRGILVKQVGVSVGCQAQS